MPRSMFEQLMQVGQHHFCTSDTVQRMVLQVLYLTNIHPIYSGACTHVLYLHVHSVSFPLNHNARCTKVYQ